MNDLDERLLLSQKKLTLLLGGLAIALPGILYLGNSWIFDIHEPLPSISSYYYSGMGDIFVGVLFSIGMFLITYEGYDRGDLILATITGIFAIMVAIIPTQPPSMPPNTNTLVHNSAAAVFYALLTVFCMLRFTKKDGKMTFKKKIRNVVYYVCGAIMTITLSTLLILTLTGYRPFNNVIFWLEYIANTAFGIAFLVKGEGVFFLNDYPILNFTPWEIYGLFILILLSIGNVIVFSSIFV